ncbi:armadillo-type protein [Syncephalis plumigaleata]|nr:armadillo-type protein [Syncephalis plumigaleata]
MTNGPNGSFKARLDAWYADEGEEEDDEDADSDMPRETSICLLDEGDQPLTPLEQIYLLLRSNITAQRIDGIEELPNLLPEISPSDAVDYCVDLIYSLADDAEDSVRCALAEQLDEILAYYFINCMLPTIETDNDQPTSDSDSNNESTDNTPSGEQQENNDDEDEDNGSDQAGNIKEDEDEEPPLVSHLHDTSQLAEAKLPSGSMVELIQKLLLDPVLSVADSAREALIRLCDRVDIPFKVLHTEVVHGAIFTLDMVEDDSVEQRRSSYGMGNGDHHEGGFGFGFGGSSMSGGFGGAPAVGRAACAIIGILAPLCHRLDDWTCDNVIYSRLLSWTSDSSYTIRRSTVPLICALMARLSSRRNELLALYTALSSDAVWHVRQACVEHLDKIVPLIGDITSAATTATSSKSAEIEEPISEDNITSVSAVEEDLFDEEHELNGNCKPSTVSPPPLSPSVLAEPGNEFLHEVLSRASISDGLLEQRATWVLERYDTFLNDTSRGVRETAWKVIGRLAAAFPRGQVPAGLVDRYINMPLANLDEHDMSVPERTVQCAYNMPAMVLMLGADRWSELSQCYTMLVGDMQASTRCSLAHSLPVLASMLPTKDADNYLFSAFQHFMQDSGEVHTAALSNFAEFLSHLSSETRKRCFPNILHWYHNGQRDWRIRETIILQLVKLSEYCTINDIADYLLQIIEIALLDRVAKIREAAVVVLAAIIARTIRDQTPITSLLGALIRMARHSEHRTRLVFLNVCRELLQNHPATVAAVRDELLPYAGDLVVDPVPNVRLATIRLFRAISPLLATDHKLGLMAGSVVCRVRNDIDYDVRSAALELEAYCPSRMVLPQVERSIAGGENIMDYEMEYGVNAYIHDMENVDLGIITDELNDSIRNDPPSPLDGHIDLSQFDLNELLSTASHLTDNNHHDNDDDATTAASSAISIRLSLASSPTITDDSMSSPTTPTSLSMGSTFTPPASTLVMSDDLQGIPTVKPLTPGAQRMLDLEAEVKVENSNTATTATSQAISNGDISNSESDTLLKISTTTTTATTATTESEDTEQDFDELATESIELNSPLESLSAAEAAEVSQAYLDEKPSSNDGQKEHHDNENSNHITDIITTNTTNERHRTERRKSFEIAALAISTRRYSAGKLSTPTTVSPTTIPEDAASTSDDDDDDDDDTEELSHDIDDATATLIDSSLAMHTPSLVKQSPNSSIVNGGGGNDDNDDDSLHTTKPDNSSCVETDQRTDKNLMVPG